MNFLTRAVKEGVPLSMVGIETVYEEGNSSSHFSTLRDSFLIYRQFFRFAGNSALCAGVDLGLFALVTALFDLQTAVLVAMATLFARLASGALNFALNRHWSFVDTGSTHGNACLQGKRYFTLFFAQMVASMTLVAALSFLPIPLLLAKVLVDGSLFVISYFIQRNWVFRSPIHPIRPQTFLSEGDDNHAEDERKISFAAS